MKRKRRKKSHKKQICRWTRRLLTVTGMLIACVIFAAGIFISRTSQKGVCDADHEGREADFLQKNKAAEEQKEVTAEELAWQPESEILTEMPDTVQESVLTIEESASDLDLQAEEEAVESDPNAVLTVQDMEFEADIAGGGAPAGTIFPLDQLDMSEFEQYFTAVPIEPGDPVYNRINGKSWQENEHIALNDLRYLKLLHYNYSGQIQVGEMIVNKSIADDVISIFEELFACGYQIQSMYLIDNYWTGDPDDSDTASIDANNSSAFCYRPITNGTKLSNHAYGKAIDLNPQQNPYVSYSSGSPKWYHENANDYVARDTGLPHVITHEDAAFLIFQKYGFLWGGDWNNPKDYQHFEKK